MLSVINHACIVHRINYEASWRHSTVRNRQRNSDRRTISKHVTEIKETSCLALDKRTSLLEYVLWCPDLHGLSSWLVLVMTGLAVEATVTLNESGEPGWKTIASLLPLYQISHMSSISDELPPVSECRVRRPLEFTDTGNCWMKNVLRLKTWFWWTTWLKKEDYRCSSSP